MASSPDLAFSLVDGSLAVGGAVLLSGVPSNVTLAPFEFDRSSSDAPPHLLDQATAAVGRGAFLGFTAPDATDRAPCSLGQLLNRKFLSVFRFKTWWSTMRAGERGRDLQPETQWLLLDAPELGPGGCVFVLPLVQGSFRSAIFPTYGGGDEDDGVVLCAESGSPAVTGTDFSRIAYVHYGTDPYVVMHEAYLAARVHLGTFKLIEEKALPPMAERFGWCTWDAFYLTVDPVGVWQGVSEFADAGFGGVIGAFNCQGAGWDRTERRIRGYAHCYKPISGTVHPADVEWTQREDTTSMANAAEYAMYKHHSGELVLVTPESDPINFTLQPSSYEIFTFAPVMALAAGGKFAPVGVVDMLNCGGTIVDVEGHSDVRVRVKGAGRLVVYSSARPEKIMVDGLEAAFEYGDGGKLQVAVSWEQDKEGVSDVVFSY